jgi:hypothetical protein
MKKIVLSFIALFIMIPFVIRAEEVNNENELETVLSETTKYYKTITFNDSVCVAGLNNLCNNSVTYEVSKEEYDSAPQIEVRSVSDGLIETAYKKLTSTIIQSGTRYKYKANLNWKTIPSTRSYDIMGIGFYGSVKIWDDDLFFEQNYTKNGSNYTTYSNYPQVFSNGGGCSFALPSGTLTALSQQLYFYVEKNTTATIIQQLAAADYAHATSTISLNNSKKYTIGAAGISHNGNSSYYDAMNTADAYWYGTW